MSNHEQDRSVDELIENWINGNRTDVIRNLSQRHPAIAAHFILEGAQRGLDVGDCRSVVNLLLDDLVEIRDSKGLEMTHRPL